MGEEEVPGVDGARQVVPLPAAVLGAVERELREREELASARVTAQEPLMQFGEHRVRVLGFQRFPSPRRCRAMRLETLSVPVVSTFSVSVRWTSAESMVLTRIGAPHAVARRSAVASRPRSAARASDGSSTAPGRAAVVLLTGDEETP
jgi:hypothetical protein